MYCYNIYTTRSTHRVEYMINAYILYVCEHPEPILLQRTYIITQS